MGWEEERSAMLKEAADRIRSAATILADQTNKSASITPVEPEPDRLMKLASLYMHLKYVDMARAVLDAEKQASMCGLMAQ